MESPGFFQTGYYHNTQFTPEKRQSDTKSSAGGDHFAVEDLLDFPNDDGYVAHATFDVVTGNSTESSAVTVVDCCNSSFSGGEPHFSGDMGGRSFSDTPFSSDLCVPYDDLAELEWLSNFVEESFSSEDLQKLQIISGIKARSDKGSEKPEENLTNNPTFHREVSVPGKARSKRSRAAPGSWASSLSVLSPTATSSPADVPSKAGAKKRSDNADTETTTRHDLLDGRKCLHCATDKTPQWRSGPMGPKTLCNACGVRYKSGRLVPEYRPAASPTFVLSKHSNSHRKVMELRRQKEVHRAHQQHQQFIHQNMVFDASSGDDYLIRQRIGPDYRHLI